MRAGKLRDKLMIQALTTGVDSYGGVTETWTDHASVWGEVEYLTGSERWRAQAVNAEAQGRVRIRYRPGIEPTMRIKHGDVYLSIISVLPADNKGRELELMFREWLDE